jgi:hypothetical protein
MLAYGRLAGLSSLLLSMQLQSYHNPNTTVNWALLWPCITLHPAQPVMSTGKAAPLQPHRTLKMQKR